jgi:hypothetical protein
MLALKQKGLVDHLHQMGKLGNRAEHFGGRFTFHNAVKLVQAKTDQDLALSFGTADRRTGLLDLDFGHSAYSVIAAAAASSCASLW